MNTQAPKKFKVLLIGDICTDEYQFGIIDRLSPEAPVPVFKPTRIETMPGMAANVEANLLALGIEIIMIGGDKSVKTRLIDERSKQHIVRIDNDVILEKPLPVELVDINLLKVDAIVISDYNKGLVSYELIEGLRKKYHGPIFIDTKKTDLARFNLCYVKINESEYNKAKSHNDNLIVTLGSNGAMYKQNGREKFYASHKVDVTDVCGAGDTFLAALVFQYLTTNNIDLAIPFANKAASITVQHMGVYAPNIKEII
jgi:bifunctional ADP-heptose synthase (sugar kinase/adenylyltransferase)